MSRDLVAIILGLILVAVSVSLWMDHSSNTHRHEFEAGVLMQHGDMSEQQQTQYDTMLAILSIIENKTDDRFRGSDAVALEGRQRAERVKEIRSAEKRMQAEIDELRADFVRNETRHE